MEKNKFDGRPVVQNTHQNKRKLAGDCSIPLHRVIDIDLSVVCMLEVTTFLPHFCCYGVRLHLAATGTR